MPLLPPGLTHAPLTWLLATLLAYRLALAMHHRTGGNALLHPVAVSTTILVTLLFVTKTDYGTYFNGTRFIHFLLGPATVALAIPLYGQIQRVRRNWIGLMAGALAGSAVAVASAMMIASLLGASRSTVLSLSAKSVTMPIAIALTEKIGGVASLTSALVMLTGVLGTLAAQCVLKMLRITDHEITGFTLGTVAHGIGASRALQISQEMGAFAGLAMGLAGAITAFLLPFGLRLAGYL